MTQNEVYNSLANFIIDLLPSKKWTRAELYIKKLERNLGMSGKCFCEDGEEVSLMTRFSQELKEQIKWLHEFTTSMGGEQNRWNRAIYTLYPEGKFDMKFIWDQALQDELDRLDRQK